MTKNLQGVNIKDFMSFSRRSFCEDVQSGVLVVDGAMGTMLYEHGAFLNRSFEELNSTDPKLVFQIHSAYVDAGADIIESNTFGANRMKLGNFGLQNEVANLNAAGVALARNAAGEDVFVAGAMGPLGLLRPPEGTIEQDRAIEVFREHAEALIEPESIDVFILETFSSLSELCLAVRAIRLITTIPVVAQVTTEPTGCTSDAATPEVVSKSLVDEGADVIGINCGDGPASMLVVAEQFCAVSTVPMAAQPNAGYPRHVDGRTLYLSSPEFVASYARRFANLGVRLVGGCCGTTPEHTRSIRRAIKRVSCEATDEKL
jgi:methionine synthase I (cobalamin-dependent)|tara:strand:+ start:9389 stop:10339 length:951 start_codon:yes stop_codon:yes gene_type:complete